MCVCFGEKMKHQVGIRHVAVVPVEDLVIHGDVSVLVSYVLISGSKW